MLTKIGIAALLGTIGTAAVGGVAKADEPCRTQVTVAAPMPIARPIVVEPPVVNVGNGYGYNAPGVYYRAGRREQLERMRRERREEMLRRAAWLHRHHNGRW